MYGLLALQRALAAQHAELIMPQPPPVETMTLFCVA